MIVIVRTMLVQLIVTGMHVIAFVEMGSGRTQIASRSRRPSMLREADHIYLLRCNRAADHLADVDAETVRRQVDLIDHRKNCEILLRGQKRIRDRLRFHALAGVHH